MTTMSKTGSSFNQVLLKTDARKFLENNQIVLNQDQIKMSLGVKNVVAMNFMCSIIKILHLKYCPVCNI